MKSPSQQVTFMKNFILLQKVNKDHNDIGPFKAIMNPANITSINSGIFIKSSIFINPKNKNNPKKGIALLTANNKYLIMKKIFLTTQKKFLMK